MTWLGGWLRELILIVLLAAFVEMLLPSKSMERYVRLVLSLLVLLTMLSPIVSLLKGDAAAELGLAIGKQEKEGGLLSGAKNGTATLEKILADGQKLAAGRKEQSLKLAAEEVAGQMRNQITTSTGTRGAKVSVTLGMGKSGASGGEDIPVISAVQVSLPAAAGAAVVPEAPDSTAAEPIVIPPVEAVEINIGSNTDKPDISGAKTATETPASGNPAEDRTASKETEAQAIIQLLEQQWGLAPGVIQVNGTDNAEASKQ